LEIYHEATVGSGRHEAVSTAASQGGPFRGRIGRHSLALPATAHRYAYFLALAGRWQDWTAPDAVWASLHSLEDFNVLGLDSGRVS